MRTAICHSLKHLTQGLHYYAPGNLLYVNNAKSGCSSIKASLIDAIGKHEGLDLPDSLPPTMVHGPNSIWSKEFHRLPNRSTYCFSMVRNPFTRVLSAYLDKICRPGILRMQFMLHHGRDPSVDLSFDEFLHLIDPTDTLLDGHWQPQYLNLLAGGIHLDDVYYLENFSETSATLKNKLGLDITFSERNQHGTQAKDKLEKYLTPSAIERILDIYQTDFELFQYSVDPGNSMDAPGDSISCPIDQTKTHRVLTIHGYTLTKEDGSIFDAMGYQAHANQRDRTLSFEEKAAAYHLPRSHELFDFGEFLKEAELVVAEGEVERRYVALQVLTTQGINCFPAETVERWVREELRMAPNDPFAHVKLIRYLTSVSDYSAASKALDMLSTQTWQKAMVEFLRKEIRDAQQSPVTTGI